MTHGTIISQQFTEIKIIICGSNQRIEWKTEHQHHKYSAGYFRVKQYVPQMQFSSSSCLNLFSFWCLTTHITGLHRLPQRAFWHFKDQITNLAVHTQKAVASPPEPSASQVHVATRFTRAAVCTQKVWKKYLNVSGDFLLPDTCQFIGPF